VSNPAGVAAEKIPRHIAIIMDGNGRWARERGLPRIEGHRRGSEAVRACTAACIEAGVSHLTLYAFSKENWQRPPDEVKALMNLLDRFLAVARLVNDAVVAQSANQLREHLAIYD
jgi:undecaprenyl diphosphate synthase